MLITSIYTLTIFTSAFLLFLIQPMISKLLLPHLGGSPAVWNTAMLFFQILLLLGYAYAHVACKYLGARKQALLHIGLVVVALGWLPIAARTDIAVVSAINPVEWMMMSLLLSVGVPFFVLAANSPLLQYWLSRTNHKDAQNPYFLYSASNIGSMLALFAYPFALEPLLTLPQQSLFWSAGFVLFGLLMVSCVIYLRSHEAPQPETSTSTSDIEKPTFKRKCHWVLLAFCPSSLLLGVTTYITTDLASIPLFWVIPLALYLLTFILAFARTPLMVDRCLSAQVILVPVTAIAILFEVNAILPILLLHLMTFFVLAMGCHGTLARLKPDARHLTEFFLWVSFGGMLGGIFNALLAPVLFSEAFEYPLVFILSLLLRPQLQDDSSRERKLDYAVPFMLMITVIALMYCINPDDTASTETSILIQNNLMPVLLFIPAAFVAIMSYKRPQRFSLFILALFVAVPIGKITGSTTDSKSSLVMVERNFFGVNRLFESGVSNAMVLLHGTTLHGMQPLDPSKKMELTTYYHVMPDVYNHLSPSLYNHPVAVLGLGAGTLACIGHAGQAFDFFEIDPAIADIARNPKFFTYLSDCPPKSNVILGDGRLEMAKVDNDRYGFIVVDTFSSDSIPVHILTREALAVYISKLAKGGMMAFNISNRHLNLAPLMAALAKDAGLVAYIKEDRNSEESELISSSMWVVLARETADLGGLEKDDTNWVPLDDTKAFAIWTDNYSNIFQTLF